MPKSPINSWGEDKSFSAVLYKNDGGLKDKKQNQDSNTWLVASTIKTYYYRFNGHTYYERLLNTFDADSEWLLTETFLLLFFSHRE